MPTPVQQQLANQFPNLDFKFDFILAPLTYFKIGGPAEAFIELSDRGQIVEVIKFCHSNNIKVTILGGASNIIVSDKGVSGLVLILTNDQIAFDGNKVTVGAGIKTALLVRETINHGLTGLEYFLGVPGRLSGAVYNNAHYLQHLIGEHITRVEIINQDGSTNWLTNQECDFAYDHSRFQISKEIILQVEFELQPGDRQTSDQLIKDATLYRANTQPLGEPSSGCIFQNVPNTPELKEKFPQFKDRTHVGGGFLIDQAGLKGTREGDIEVSHKHAAFFINKGHGTAEQVLTLIKKVKQRVKDQFGVELHEEVFFIGD